MLLVTPSRVDVLPLFNKLIILRHIMCSLLQSMSTAATEGRAVSRLESVPVSMDLEAWLVRKSTTFLHTPLTLEWRSR